MPNFEIVLNPKKALKRGDLVEMGEIMAKEIKNPQIEALVLKITDDMKGGENAISFHFPIVEK